MNTTDKVQVGDSTTGTSTTTTYKTSSSSPIEYGWVCPRCNRVNAPWKSTCDCSGGYYYPIWEYKEPWWKQVYCNGTSAQSQIDSNTFKIHPESTTYYSVGGSDYWDNMNQVWTNNPNVSNKVNPNTATTAWNNGPSTQTIHNGKSKYKE